MNKMPAAFRDHGSPMNAVARNRYTDARSSKCCPRRFGTLELYLPLLYVSGTRQGGDAVTFPVEGIDGGSVSMLAVEVG
jgi:aromatic ring-opening dioxygenase catalytic subunit (LigB family)